MAGKATQVLDETWEIGDNAPHERTDMPLDRSDFAELTVRTARVRARGIKMARLLKWADGKKTKKWCEHCKANHWSTTKCPYLEKQTKQNPGSTTPKDTAPTAPSKAALPKNLPEKTQKKLLDAYGAGVAEALGEALSNLPLNAHGFGLSEFLTAIPASLHENAEAILQQLTADGVLKQKSGGGWAFVDKPSLAPEKSAPGIKPPSVESLGGALEKLPVEGWEPGAAQTLAAGILDMFGKGEAYGDILSEQSLKDGLAGMMVDPKVIDLALGALKNSGILQSQKGSKLKLTAPAATSAPTSTTPASGPLTPDSMSKALVDSGLQPGMASALGKVLLKQFLKDSPDGVGVSVPEKALVAALTHGHGWTPALVMQGLSRLKAKGVLVDDGLGGLSLSGPAVFPKPGSDKPVGAKPKSKLFDGKALAKSLGFPALSIGSKALEAMGHMGVPWPAKAIYDTLGLKGAFDGLAGKKLTNLLDQLVDDGQLQKLEPPGGGPPQYFYGSWEASEPVPAGLTPKAPVPAPEPPEETPEAAPPEPGALPTDEAVPAPPGEEPVVPEPAPIPEPATPPPGVPVEEPLTEPMPGVPEPPAGVMPAPEPLSPTEAPESPATTPGAPVAGDLGSTLTDTYKAIDPFFAEAGPAAQQIMAGQFTKNLMNALPAGGATLQEITEGLSEAEEPELTKKLVDALVDAGHLVKNPAGKISWPADKAPTGVCPDGHVTYVSPAPHNCPSCGKVMEESQTPDHEIPAAEESGWGMSDDEPVGPYQPVDIKYEPDPLPEPDYAPAPQKYDELNGLGGPFHEALQNAGMTFDTHTSFLNLLKDVKSLLGDTPDKAQFTKDLSEAYTPEDVSQVVGVLDAMGIFGTTTAAPASIGKTQIAKDVFDAPDFLQQLKHNGVKYPAILGGALDEYFDKEPNPTKEGLEQHLADEYTPETLATIMQALDAVGLFGGEEPEPVAPVPEPAPTAPSAPLDINTVAPEDFKDYLDAASITDDPTKLMSDVKSTFDELGGVPDKEDFLDWFAENHGGKTKAKAVLSVLENMGVFGAVAPMSTPAAPVPSATTEPKPSPETAPTYGHFIAPLQEVLSELALSADENTLASDLIGALQDGPKPVAELKSLLVSKVSGLDASEASYILSELKSNGLLGKLPDGSYNLTGDPLPSADAKPTGECPTGHKTYKSPVPHNCPTCGKVMAPAATATPPPTAPAIPAPVLSATESHQAFEDLGINPGGKSITFLKTLNTQGAQGLTLAEALAACPDPPSGTPKIQQADAEALLQKAIDKGLVSEVPGTTPPKYVFGKVTGTPKTPRQKSFETLLGTAKIDPASDEAKALGQMLQPDGSFDLAGYQAGATPELAAAAMQAFNKLDKMGLVDNTDPGSPKVKGYVTAPSAPTPASGASKFTQIDPSEVVSKLNWAVDGKGNKLLQLLNKNGPAGMSLDDVLNAWGDPNVKPKKPDAALAQTLLQKAIDNYLVQQVPGSSPPKYVLGYFGDTKPAAPPPPPPGAVPPGTVLKKMPGKLYAPSYVPSNVLTTLGAVTANVTVAPLPKVTAPPTPAPDGVLNSVYELAHRMGQDLHNPAQLAVFMGSKAAKLATLVDVDPKSCAFLQSKGFSKADIQKMVNDGLFEVDSPNSLFSETGANNWLSANLTKKTIRRAGDKALNIPTPTKVTYAPAPGGAKVSYEMDPDVADAVGGWEQAGMPPAVKSMLTILSTAPDKRWSGHELAAALGPAGYAGGVDDVNSLFKAIPPHLESLFERIGGAGQQNIRLNLPVLMSATNNATGPACPKCKVHHRPTTKCPQEAGPDAIDLDSYYEETGAYGLKKPVFPGKHQLSLACVAAASSLPIPEPEPLPPDASLPAPPSSPTGKPLSLNVAVNAMNAKPGTIGHTVLSALTTPQSEATLAAVLQSAGFKWKPASFLKKAVGQGVLEQLPGGDYALKGTYAAQQAAGLGPGPSMPGPGESSHLMPDVAPQSLPTLAAIRQQYSEGHPIHGMKPKHAARYHQLLEHFRKVADPATNAALQRIPPAKRDIKTFMLAAGAAQTGYSRAANLMFGDFWCGHQTSYGGKAIVATLNQLGLNRSPSVATLQGLTANTSDIDVAQDAALKQLGIDKAGYGVSDEESGCQMFMHATDPDAPTIMQIELSKYSDAADVAKEFGVPPDQVAKSSVGWFIKGASRGEIILQQMTSQQAAFQHGGESSASLFRGITDGPPYHPITAMESEHAASYPTKGHGSKVFLNAASSWSMSHSAASGFSSFGSGLIMQKIVPNYENLYTCLQDLSSPANGKDAPPTMIFQKHVSEDEYVVLGHNSKTLDKAGAGKTIKISQLKRPPVVQEPWPQPDPQIPPGFGRLVTNQRYQTFWVTSQVVMYCVPPMPEEQRPRLDDLSVGAA